MAKVIKLKDREGSLVLPLTRSQLVQVSQISGLDLLDSKNWNKASVQDALEALYSYASTISNSNATALSDIATIKNALKDVLDNQRAVADYADNVKVLAYAEAASKATEAQANSYAEAASKATAAETAAKNYADGKFLTNVKLNNEFINVQTDANGRYVDLGSIATSEGLQNLTNKVNAIEAAYITKTASEEADAAIVTAYENADAAIITGYQAADAAIISSYTAADTAIISSYTAADKALSDEINALKTSYGVTVTEVTGSGDILKGYEIKQNGVTLGTVNIPKDMVATQGAVVYCTKSGDTYTEVASTTEGAIACIKMTVGNGNKTDSFYVEVADLIEYNGVRSNDEITLSDTGHVIEATVGSISSSKITFTPAGENPTDTTVQAALRNLYSQVGEGGSVTTQIQNAIDALDASYTASGTAAHNGTFVMNAVTQTDGKITSIGSVEVEAAGAADAVKTELKGGATTYTNLGAVETEIGAIRTAIDGLDDAAVKSVNGQTPNASGAVTVNASQIDTVNTYKIGSDSTATTHKVDEVLAAGVYFEEIAGASGDATADTTLFA